MPYFPIYYQYFLIFFLLLLKIIFQRQVPNSPVRKGSFVGKNAVLMPCYVNIGAYIDEGTMMDTFSRAGSCCQIGKNCHISAGSGIGGVLEPAQALPTIIEDNCFIGAMSEVVEGVIVGEGSVLSMGMYIGQSTKIVNRKTGEITKCIHHSTFINISTNIYIAWH